MQWAQTQRMRFIEDKLRWEGRINRSDISAAFGVSMVQATTDLQTYQRLAPQNIQYDGTVRAYLPTPQMKPEFGSPSSDAVLGEMARGDGPAEIMPLPSRHIAPSILRPILQAISDEKNVCIVYQSLSRPESTERVIRPHTFVSDGRRWHVRGYCEETGEFRDFLLARILGVDRIEQPSEFPGPEKDTYWNSIIQIILAPHPGLSPMQQKVITEDYGMTEGKGVFPLRHAYLPYLLRRLNLVKSTDQAREQQLMIVNREDVDRWHKEIMPAKEVVEEA